MISFTPMAYPVHHWTVRKPAVESRFGVVASQVYDASAAGVAVLEAGGNAVDAAVATAFALAAVEPWNSGLGGMGFAIVHPASEPAVSSVNFGPVAPRALRAEQFPLTGRPGSDLFPWPQVKDDLNAHGGLSFCLPTAVAGYATMLERWGTMPLSEVLQPAISLAKRGLAQDWFTTLMLAQAAPLLRKYRASSEIFLHDGLPPVPPYQGTPGFLPLGRLPDTLERLARAGWRDFYQGEVARSIVRDTADLGGVISQEELASYQPELGRTLDVPWGTSTVQLSSGLNAGPTLAETLTYRNSAGIAYDGEPDAKWYAALATAMKGAYLRRLDLDGDSAPTNHGCTSHINVCDASGSMVALTTTLLSSMGGRAVLPSTGFLMNNGVLWFDPRPGRPNSIGSGRRPLSNMCPVIVKSEGRPVIVCGAAGGRRIMAAVGQLLLFVNDFRIPVEDAAHLPRIDVSGSEKISIDRRLGDDVVNALRAIGDVERVDHNVLPINFARPSIIERLDGTVARGVSDAFSPWSAALGGGE
ncbi:gamma-glutamyltransferase [Paraburkholderia sacchari]|uniref:gamma-glutamyltransferase n=1 Tax=Paraburkholderia sacchari TaxID=159450 RepID=UPI001BD1590D|nr:gamma-glutamyltransferase [Paraburkholderia sacchari]